MRFTKLTPILLLALIGGLVAPNDSAADDGSKVLEAGKRPAEGDRVREFELPIVGSDDTIKLSEAHADGPTVVVVLRGYPGYQCGICSRQFAAFRNRAKALGGQVGKVIMVYPGAASQLEQHASEFIGSQTVPSPLVMVRDPNMEMIQDWGLRWKAPRETAYPSTFVIDQSGKVVWAQVSDGHGGRSNVESVMKALRKAKS